MNIIIYGAGAIGCHLAYCLSSYKNNIALITKKKYLKIYKQKGIDISIYSNEVLKKKTIIKENDNLRFYSKLEDLDSTFKNKIDFIFITIKLKDFSSHIEKKIFLFSKKNTCIVPPCTYLSRWWFYKSFPKTKLPSSLFPEFYFFKKYKKNIVGMTMWVSALAVKPGVIHVKHIQRGYPIMEFDKIQKKKIDKLRNQLRRKCMSPSVKNILSELYIKAINSFAFNLLALKTEYNNKMLKKDKRSILAIKKIFEEFDKIINSISLPIIQSRTSRIMQTLSSTNHTLSMLTDYKNKKKVELIYLWKTFVLLSKLAKKNIVFTKNIYSMVLKKIK